MNGGMDIYELADETNRTVRDLIAKMQNDGYLREKADTTNPENQTVNHMYDGHYEYGSNGPEFDSERSEEIIDNYTLPKSNKPKTK